MFRPTPTTTIAITLTLAALAATRLAYAGSGIPDAPRGPQPLVGDPCFEGSDVPDAFSTIQAAIDAASNGDEIVVAPGTYNEQIDLLGKAVHLRACGGPNVTIIDGGGAAPVVTCTSAEGGDTLLDGFTITGGFFNPSGPGGGMCIDNASPTITNCVFNGNVDGGISIEDGSPTITYSTFSDNDQGGILCQRLLGSADPTISNCIFDGNEAGAALSLYESDASVTNCEFTDNLIGMIVDGNPTVERCLFSGNIATSKLFTLDGGGMRIVGGSPKVTNCMFTQNVADGIGGGVFVAGETQSGAAITNCLFTKNSALAHGAIAIEFQVPITVTNCTVHGNGDGAIGYAGGTPGPTFTNCVLWNNGDDSSIVGPGGAAVNWSDVQTFDGRVAPGTGNIHADPQLLAPGSGDFRLGAASPCIDAAGNSAPGLAGITEDLDGHARFIDHPMVPDTGSGSAPIIDMGAYENLALPCPIGTVNVPGEYATIQAAINSGCLGMAVEIVVAPGTYNEAIDLHGHPVRLRSSGGPEVTIIDATGLDSTVVEFVSGEGPDTILEGFTITGGTDPSGGGIRIDGSSPTISRCIVTGNAGVFGGGIRVDDGSPVFINCTIGANTGSGLSGSGSAVLTNCTVAGNAGDGVFGPATITNCIVRGNTGDQISNGGSGDPSVTWSNVQGGFAGTGNIDADPVFIDAAGGDLRLSPGSPCIDAADNDAPGLVGISTDLDGDPRFADDPETTDTGNPGAAGLPIVDMGAYEGQYAVCTEVPDGVMSWWTGEVDGADAVGGNDGMLVGGAVAGVPGLVGGAFQLDDVDDRIITSDTADGPGTLSVAAWIRPDDVAAGLRRIVTKFAGSGSTPGSWVFDVFPDGSLRFAFADDTATFISASSPPGTVASGSWQFVAATYDGDTLNVYRNHAAVGTNVVNLGPVPALAQPIVIGEDDPVGSPEHFGGLIDEVVLFDRALDAVELLAVFQAGTEGLCAPACPPDADGNGVVNIDDVVLVVLNFGSTGEPGLPGDVDGSGIVDIDDIVLVVLNFGLSCE